MSHDIRLTCVVKYTCQSSLAFIWFFFWWGGGGFTDTRGCCCCCFLTRTVSSRSWSFSSLESIWPPASQLCNVHVCLCVEAWVGLWVGEDVQNPVEHKARFCGTSKPPLYLCSFSPWEWHICDSVTSHTMSQRLLLLQEDRQLIHASFYYLLQQRKHPSDQRGVSMLHGPS